MVRSIVTVLALTAVLAAPAAGQEAPVKALIDSQAFKTATAFIEKDESRFVKELIELTIPAQKFLSCG